MQVSPATVTDLPFVRATYADARALQRARGVTNVWPEFGDDEILRDIAAGRLFLVVDGGTLAGIFTALDADPDIWGARERGAHVYLHRIARAAGWNGRGLTEAVLAWAEGRCRSLGREGIRLDTWADNAAMVAHYGRLGFALVGHVTLPADPRLAAHYHGLELALMERASAGA